MNILTKSIADVACERFVYSNSDALASFIEQYDDPKTCCKRASKTN